MKLLLIIVSLITITFCSHNHRDVCEKYFKVLDQAISDPVLMKQLLDCYSDLGPCSETGACFKSRIYRDLLTACSACSVGLLARIKLFYKFARPLFPNELAILRNKYDPENNYWPAYDAYVDKF